MTGGEAFRAKLLTRDALDASVSAYLADPSQPVVLEIGDKRLDVAAAVLAHKWSTDELAVEDATPERRRQAVRTAVLVAPVG
ncbi:hypothetical protein [Methylobacterium platani]|uniref:Uncharacterized protein n=2 Tax=Methylobacterium platani TaxID=427683 RepID=A0A179RZA5_9HYPH|nr:hypothetical protein [Methylobacterium platani]KMO14862.1 hypothetical protein SQ03_18390 [Methylobacterium platani JCM 14648]OAS16185.1 hypothetical protein A5481_28545 [Methylobacterium platani]